MTTITFAHLFLAFIAGVLLIGYGEVDDSPGAQGIGLLTALLSVVLFVYYARRRS